MQVAETESARKRLDDYQLHNQQISDRATHLIAVRFALSRDHAREVARLAGLGADAEARS